MRRLRMTAEQIHAYSQTWPWPFNTVKELDRRLDRLKLRRKIRWKGEQSKHEQAVLLTFIKIAWDAHRAGYEVADVEKEYSIGHGSQLRADMKFRIGDRLYFLEFEIANRSDGWTGKIRKYLHYRKSKGTRPFRTLIIFDNKAPLTRTWYATREIMKPHPGLELFLFGWAADTPMGQPDCVTQPVWTTHKGLTVPLIPPRGHAASPHRAYTRGTPAASGPGGQRALPAS